VWKVCFSASSISIIDSNWSERLTCAVMTLSVPYKRRFFRWGTRRVPHLVYLQWSAKAQVTFPHQWTGLHSISWVCVHWVYSIVQLGPKPGTPPSFQVFFSLSLSSLCFTYFSPRNEIRFEASLFPDISLMNNLSTLEINLIAYIKFINEECAHFTIIDQFLQLKQGDCVEITFHTYINYLY
jgi:hypothetical protein